jgi:hypothetical protein
MVPIQWQIGAISILLSLVLGLVLGASVGVLAALAFGMPRRVVLDSIMGMAGFVSGYAVSVLAGRGTVELNEAIVAWQGGHDCLGLRRPVFEYPLLTAVAVCLLFVVLGRATVHRRPQAAEGSGRG